MTWILLALAAHVLNALVFVIDKGLLEQRESTVGRPAWYAAYSGLVAAGAGVLLIYTFAMPTWPILVWSAIAGLFWMVALWLFFVALKNGEPSRVVPITGSSVPVCTLVAAILFLGERLLSFQLVSVGLLIAGGVLLSIRVTGRNGISRPALWAAIASGAAFAGHFAVTKYVYSFPEPFLALFAYVRLGVGVWAGLLFLVLWQRRQRSPAARSRRPLKWAIGGIAAAFVLSKIVGMVALLLQNYAIAVGSVTVVNALQGTQYFFVLVLALIVSQWAPRFFREELHRVALLQKVGGVLCIAVGLVLLV